MNTHQRWIARSYAKINLGLYIHEKRADGYHNITTGFCFIDWSDRFVIERNRTMHLSLSDDSIPAGDTNLILRAIELLRQKTDLKSGFHIDVRKVIPAGSGLGGGSSNAALTLRMINKIESLALKDNDLCKIAGQLGADIPFFISNQPAIGTGTGSTLTPAPIQPDAWIVTVWPGFSSSTADAYKMINSINPYALDLKELLVRQEFEDWPFLLQNDLEAVVMLRYPQIGHLKDNLYSAGAVYASMSGSGSSVFGLFEQEFVAQNAYNEMMELGYRANLTQPLFKPDTGIYLEA